MLFVLCLNCSQGVVCNVLGVPKSIDNDILIIDRCFGVETAVEEAQRALLAAKVIWGSSHTVGAGCSDVHPIRMLQA